MSEIRAVLFDLDGVLVDSYEAWFHMVRRAARDFCQEDVTRERFDAGWGQGIEADLQTFFPGRARDEVTRYYERHLMNHADAIRVDPQAEGALVTLRAAGLPRAVVTNTPTFLARDILAYAGLLGLVDVTVGAEPGLAPKPAPDSVQRACKLLEVPPQASVVVGDSRFDAEAARAAGAAFIGFRNAAEPHAQQLTEVVDLVLSQTAS